ncbi:MAG: glutamate formimidoyltransferase [Saprospiraceae bacterium]|nr:glutamate formimidoyltransferase [Saprospiraceae bacterium]
MNSEKQIMECVPNFSEGRDMNIINKITAEVEQVDKVRLLDVDPGKATNRTVVTFVGPPEPVVEAAFRAIKKAYELIDMSKHQGEHPRFGATDVCPFIPISGMTMEDCVKYAHKLGERLAEEIGLSGYYYENAASSKERQNLATVRAGEYEGLPDKMKDPKWKPDFGPAEFNPKFGVVAVGARDFLIAYNVNLNTTSVRRANSVAFDVREKGRVKREGHPLTGEIVRDDNGDPVRIPGMCKSVKGIGWYIEEYGIAQISMNLTDIKQTALHEAFEACRKSAYERGLRVTGSELVGLVPKKVMIDAGQYFLRQQQRSLGISEEETIKIAVKSMGLDELTPFDPDKKIIEYMLEDEGDAPLVNMKLNDFAHMTASESPAPGGGSVSAYVGALGVSLGTMVANLSSHKRGWDHRWEEYSQWAEKGQALQSKLLDLVDEDTASFNKILEAFRMPKGTDEEKAERKEAIQNATRYAMEVPLEVVKTCSKAYDIFEFVVKEGLQSSVSDGAVGSLCTTAAMEGALLNVKINAGGLDDKELANKMIDEGNSLLEEAKKRQKNILEEVSGKI